MTLSGPGRRRSVQVAADVEPALHDRLAALRGRHGVTLAAVVAAGICSGWSRTAAAATSSRGTSPSTTRSIPTARTSSESSTCEFTDSAEVPDAR